MSKVIKQMQMDALKSDFKGVRDLVLLNVVGLGAIPENKIRLDLRKKGIRLQMVKNSLARRVFNDLGVHVKTGWEGGSTTVAWGAGSVAELSKEVETIVKKNDKKMKVKTAVADGQEVAFAVALKMPTKLRGARPRRDAGAGAGPQGSRSDRWSRIAGVRPDQGNQGHEEGRGPGARRRRRRHESLLPLAALAIGKRDQAADELLQLLRMLLSFKQHLIDTFPIDSTERKERCNVRP